MDNSIKITLIIVSAVVLLALIGVFAYMQLSPSGNTVDAQGIAQIKAVPDLVSVYFNIQTENVSAKDAKDDNAKIVNDVTTALVMLGLERKDITTENFNIYPQYDYRSGEQSITGYQTTHTLKVQLTTKDSDKIGEVIDAGINNGALISYINFELSQDLQNQYKADALKAAGEDAKIKAEATAAGLGKSLGRLVSITTSNFDYYPWPIYRAMDSVGVANAEAAKQATTNIQPGEQTISGSVNVVYKLR